ncbi:MAG TPA: phosphatidylglycerol lysyltransferase domain-containing protein [Caproicibacter sp.]|nr:phosphatidylglycerol lysyltransferase domain-containing protein [Caproicibacter sp.]
MLNFSKLNLTDIETVKPYFKLQLSRICDYSVGGIFMWRDYFDTQFAIWQNTLIFKVRYIGGETAFPVPLGENQQGALDQIEQYCRENGIPLVFCTVSKEALQILQSRYPGAIAQPNRNWFDYLYQAQNLITFKGKKYDGQRNHINKFKKLYPNYSFKEMKPENLESIRLFYDRFAEEHEKASQLARVESEKVKELLENYEQYGLFGGFITVDGKIVSMSIGERINDTIYVHVEKADIAYVGAYQITVQEFLKHFAREGDEFVNREEDVGDAGLRKSKLSYHPVELLEKSTVRVNL